MHVVGTGRDSCDEMTTRTRPPSSARLQASRAASTPGVVRHLGRLVTRSGAMIEAFDLIDRLARTDVTVTLIGDTGVGKEVFAHTLKPIDSAVVPQSAAPGG